MFMYKIRRSMTMNCGEKIAKLRKAKDMTQAELGDALNVTYQAVSKWERGESQPDFDTISKIAKLFQVPISHFEDDGGAEEFSAAQEPAENPTSFGADVLGMCVQCGKIVRADEAAITEPKLICKACDELNKREEQARIEAEQQAEADAKQREKSRVDYAKGKLRKHRNIALIIAAIPAAASIIAGLVLGIINSSLFGVYFGGGFTLALFLYTFTAQMIWDGTVREVCTGGGHVISLPGIIFSLSPDGLIFLIVTKIFLSVVAAIVFVGSILFCVLAAIIISPVTFIPSLLLHNREINKIK